MSDDIDLTAVCTTYAGDDPRELAASLDSIRDQSRPPEELVIVKDGPVPEGIEETIDLAEDEAAFPVVVDELSTNRGHGGALKRGFQVASGEYVAIHDADDICLEDRFRKQLSVIDETGADVVGGYIAEFEDDPAETHAVREVPTEHENIVSMAKFRCPINQTTVVARRSAVLRSGNYRAVDRMEDYELWVRMIQNGYRFRNLPDVVVKVRAGSEMYGRRGGLEYAREEIRIQRYFHEIGFISFPRAVANTIVRLIPRLLPTSVRGALYQRWLRE
ncbi:glycosyltransferase [Halostella sp. PRR32]|uniref:glycosyltransferase n=1 Tax=Halostella sp. PRR32 TaxID=3098147 RepID=UPI002B1D8C84|nr:glycosyltransferase [Halostella sp. PRR32]